MTMLNRITNLRRLTAVSVSALILLLVAGCNDASINTNVKVAEETFIGLDKVKLFTVDGVDCIFVKHGYGGGLSCNWQKFNDANINGN